MPPKPRPKGSRGSPGGGGAAAQNASSHVARQPVPPPAPGIRPVNYVDIEKEHDGDAEDGSFQTTDTIQPFVKLVCEACAGICPKFGFQPSSVHNQRENVLMLAANIYSTVAPGKVLGRSQAARAVTALHAHTLGSYENWALNMHGMRTKTVAYKRQEGHANDRGADGFNGLSEEEQMKTEIYEVVLWWCIWGEAANMRFIPEFLSWVFWSLVSERHSTTPPKGRPGFGKYDEGHGFLRKVMRPMYDYVASEAFKKDQAGNNCDHSQKKNLDDINEFFWKKSGNAACTQYDAFEIGTLIGHLGSWKKTYVERRGLLHSVKNNLRVFTIYICLFHLIVTVAHYVPFEQNTLPLCPPQLRSDICLAGQDMATCGTITGCSWGKDFEVIPKESNGYEELDTVLQCYDTCAWMESDNPVKLVPRKAKDCTDGCKWDKTDSTVGVSEAGSCHRFSSKSSQEILDNIEQTTYFNCDPVTGVCRYADSKGVPQQFTCLQHLSPDDRTRYKALNIGEWWEFHSAGMWDNAPILGRFTTAMDPDQGGSDMSAKRAEQIHLFDELWAQEVGGEEYYYKREFLEVEDLLFTCGFDISMHDGLMRAANQSHCCNIELGQPDEHAFVSVWSESHSCRWSLTDILDDEYNEVRMELTTTVMALLACRLAGQLLSFISIYDSSQTKTFMTGKLIWAGWYAFMLIVLSLILVFSVHNLDELQNIQGQVSPADPGTDEPDEPEPEPEAGPQYLFFEIVAMIALVPELFFDSNSAFDVVAKLLLCVFPQSCSQWVHDLNKKSFAYFQPGYVRKIKGRMSSKTGPWIRYSLIWVLLLGAKCYFSYLYEIRLAVKNEATTWRAIATPFKRSDALLGDQESFWDQFLLNSVQSAAGGASVARMVVFLTWVPTFVVFVMDSQIAFSLCQMVVGVWTGLNLRVGQVNTWSEFERRLARKLIPKFRVNLDATTRSLGAVGLTGANAPRVSSAELPGGGMIGSFRFPTGSRVPMQGMRGTLLYGSEPSEAEGTTLGALSEDGDEDDATGTNIRSAFTFSRRAHSFKRFVECWNLFIEKLRYDDYLSDREVSLYTCMILPSLGAPWLPPLLTLDGIGNLLDRIDALEDSHKAVYHGRVGERREQHQDLWKTDSKQFIRSLKDGAADSETVEALECVKTLTLYLLKMVTGAEEEFKPRSDILNWFNTLRFESCDDEILKKLLTDPTKGSAKGKRDTLRDLIATFAATVDSALCSPQEGTSKQRNVAFDRATDRREVDEAAVEALRKATKPVLEQLQAICEGTDYGSLDVGTVKRVLECPFFKDDRDIARLRTLGIDGDLLRAATYLSHVLKTRRADAAVVNGEARRRILTFASSLHMDMPKPKTVRTCKSLTSFTPFFAEDVLFTKDDIMKDDAAMLHYLQTVHTDEWDNLVQRLGIAADAKAAGDTVPDWVWDDEIMATEVRLWASLRGQTLARTIHGVMQFEVALLLFARQEDHQDNAMAQTGPRDTWTVTGGRGGTKLWGDDSMWTRYAHMKFQYVISCQIYGNWSDSDAKKQAVNTMLRLFPHLRIAYVKQEPDVNGDTKWFSFLIRWCEEKNQVVICYRIEQAASKGGNGNWGPTWLVGEGKPENQNHAIVFTRGQYLQTLDMNQDGYFEEALKMRNLLEEFAPAESKEQQQVRIIGFPEHQFSDTLSAVAEFSALTEFTFATLIQRSLGSPFDVRMHYGHPDIFDRVFHVTRGGISKPMKGLCVSEDIFGAFNSVLKGGQVIYREYIKQGKGKDLGFDACSLFEQKISGGNGEQALSRDYARLTEQMGITRLLSFFHSSNGFYWSNVFVIWATSWFLYGQILISVVIPDDNADALLTVTESVVFAFQLGLVLTVPLIAELILEKGPVAAFEQMLRVVCRGGPLFFMFHIRTKAYYYDRDLTLGGAGYKATGRGFVLKHTQFVPLFQMFHYSHLNYGMTLVLNMIVYRFFIVDVSDYAFVTWSTWLFALDLIFAPFMFNCLALDQKEVASDVEAWSKFLWRDDRQVLNEKVASGRKNLAEAAKESWRAYFLAENDVYTTIDIWTRLSLIFRDLIWVILPLGILLERNASSTENVSGFFGFWRAAGVGVGTSLFYAIGACGVLGLLVLIWDELAATNCCPICCQCSCRRQFSAASNRCCVGGTRSMFCNSRKVKRYCLVGIATLIMWTLLSLFMNYGKPLEVMSIWLSTFGYLTAFATNAIFYMGFRPEWVFTAYWMHDAVLGYCILLPFQVLSVFKAFSDAHMFILYNAKFVEVLKTRSFKAAVMGVVDKQLADDAAIEARKTRTVTVSQRARGVKKAAQEPEPEPEVGVSRPASPQRCVSPARPNINCSTTREI